MVYYPLVQDTEIWLVTLYDKDEATDLSSSERRLLKMAIEKEIQQRTARRASRRK